MHICGIAVVNMGGCGCGVIMCIFGVAGVGVDINDSVNVVVDGLRDAVRNGYG